MKNFFRALVDLLVGLLVLIVLAVSAVCLFPVTIICAILGLFYFAGTRMGWIDPKDYETEIGDEPVLNTENTTIPADDSVKATTTTSEPIVESTMNPIDVYKRCSELDYL
jgi:hypothetical protein